MNRELRCSCELIVIDMNPATGVFSPPLPPPLSFANAPKILDFGFQLRRKSSSRRHLNLLVTAQLSNPLSLNFGLDSQVSIIQLPTSHSFSNCTSLVLPQIMLILRVLPFTAYFSACIRTHVKSFHVKNSF